MTKILAWMLLVLGVGTLSAQHGEIEGTVYSGTEEVAFATISLEGTKYGAVTDDAGIFSVSEIPYGEYTLTTSYVGLKTDTRSIVLSAKNPKLDIAIQLSKADFLMDEVVVTGTKTFKRKTDAPVIVGVIDSKLLDNVQACNLSEGLRFQPGLRVETDCQTCNYTQLRMNGLTGGYSQILINGRPIFSPLTGLYGMEQLPVNMIDRIEVVRGGGSSLYGSSAIGGTVNVITKIPKKNRFDINYNFQTIDGKSHDHQIMGNSTLLAKNKKAGVSFFFNRRQRDYYDHNDDNYSEIPKIDNTSLGMNTFFLPSDNQKLELSLSNLREYRIGGEMVDGAAFLQQQSEERTHNVWMGSADYHINMNDNNTSLITYAAWQRTFRKHYTGVVPDSKEEIQAHNANPPYGNSDVSTYNVGLQLNHNLQNLFGGGTNTLTLGSEYVYDDVYDVIPAYKYKVDQTTKNIGLFFQSDWQITSDITLLTGLRMDKHNLVDNPVFSPRASLLYKLGRMTQVRLSYGGGFRAPQAFDTDLHIAFAGGGISRVILSPDLKPEYSQSYTASINYDYPTDSWITGFTLEGFYTRLDNAFYLKPNGEDSFGELFLKENGQGAIVQGVTLETRANFNKKIQVEAGLTVQKSLHDTAIEYVEGLPSQREFIRTPQTYGFATLAYTPDDNWYGNINYVYTGSMSVPHFAGAPNQTTDEIHTSSPFSEISAKLGYKLRLKDMGTGIEIYGGVKNVFNAYQSHFDIGKNRDSNFVFGPAQPRTIYVGLKMYH